MINLRWDGLGREKRNCLVVLEYLFDGVIGVYWCLLDDYYFVLGWCGLGCLFWFVDLWYVIGFLGVWIFRFNIFWWVLLGWFGNIIDSVVDLSILLR